MSANQRSNRSGLEESRREREGLKRDIASLRRLGLDAPSRQFPAPTVGSSYSDVAKSSTLVQHCSSSFAQAFVTALEAVLSSAGLMLASTC